MTTMNRSSYAASHVRVLLNHGRVLVVIMFCLSISNFLSSQTWEKPLVVVLARSPQKPTPACNDGRISGKIREGENLITARRPDLAAATCNPALETKCSDPLQKEAQECIRHAIALQQFLDELSQKFGAIDSYLVSYRFGDAATLAEGIGYDSASRSANGELISGYVARNLDCTDLDPSVCADRKRSLVGYIDTELRKRAGLSENYPVLAARGSLGKIFGVTPPPPLLTWLFWFLMMVLFAWLVVHFLQHLWCLKIRRNWVVWSVLDESNSGGSGAVMDALDWRANPLLQADPSGDRLLCWLAPPFLPDDSSENARNTVTVWRSLAGNDPKETERIWNLSEKIKHAKDLVPDFILNPAYEELDVNVGGFTLKGLNGLRKFALQTLLRKFPSVIGIVTRQKANGKVSWGVRLNANVPLENRTVSVFAESLPQEFGDSLAQVAQRSALKLVLRIADKNEDANTVTAQAAYRQGLELIKQLI